MTEITSKELRYKKISITLFILFTLFWILMILLLLFMKILPDYRRANTVDYSLLFKENAFTNFTTMKIYLNDKYLGQTKTIITETEGGGRTIKGETTLSVDNPLIAGMLKINSTINVSPGHELEDLNITFVIPFKEKAEHFRIDGKKEGDNLIMEIPLLNIREKIEIGNEIMTAGISPFSEVMILEVGKKWDVGMMDPLSRKLKKMTIKVVSEETIEWMGQKEKVFKLECRDQGGGLLATAWVDGFGRTLKEVVTFMGMTLELKRHD